MYAIIKTGGKQYTVKEGDIIDVEKLSIDEGEMYSFDEVLLLSTDDGIKVGTPLVENVSVEGKVLKTDKAKKIVVFKMKSKKGYRRKQGHRQPFTRIQIDKIESK